MAVEDRGAELVAVIWVFTALAIITVALKLVTRAHILHIVGWDDVIILFSLCLLVVCTCIFTYDVYPLGMGRHSVDIPLGTISDTIRINYIGNPFGIMAYSFPNIAIVVLLERILAPNKLRAVALYTMAGLQCTIAGISCVLLFTQCTPTEYLWNPEVEATTTVHCLDAGTLSRYSYFVGSFTAATDIILGVVPITAFWNLKLPMRTKVGLCLCMSCTLFAAICAIVKTTNLDELENLADFSYATVDLIIWAIVEAAVIIIAACIPTLRPFFGKTFAKQEHVSEGAGFFRRLGSLFTSNSNKSSSRLMGSGGGMPGSTASRGLKIPSAEPSRWGSGRDSGDQSVQDAAAAAAAAKHSIRHDSRTAIWRTTEIEMESAPHAGSRSDAPGGSSRM